MLLEDLVGSAVSWPRFSRSRVAAAQMLRLTPPLVSGRGLAVALHVRNGSYWSEKARQGQPSRDGPRRTLVVPQGDS
jgi:hypothetical protein